MISKEAPLWQPGDLMQKVETPSSQSTGQTAPPRDGKSNNVRKRVLLALVIAVVAAGVYMYFVRQSAPPATTLHASGRIEGYETNIGPKIGGRVDFVAAREGELVKLGQPLVKLSDSDVQAQLRGAQSRVLSAQEKAADSQYQLEVVRNQISEAKLLVAQSKEDTVAQVNQAEANVSTANARVSEAQAQVAQARSDLQLARIRRDRYGSLIKDGAVTTDEYDQVKAAADNTEALVSSRLAALDAARKQLGVSKAGLEIARTSRLNPSMRNAQLVVLQKQLMQADFKSKSAQHDIANATSEVDQIKSNIAYLNVNSPISGVVTARAVEPGAVVVPGQTLLSLIDLSNVYLRAFVPEGDIGRIRVGQKAQVYLDSQPKKPFEGEVIQIDPEGSFTPENIYFKEDRVKQVFGIKILIKQPDRFAKPGMPADAEISLVN